MNQPSDNSPHSVRRIVLPSGRTIEVVRFTEGERGESGLHLCPQCASDLVQPRSWSEVGDGTLWELTLECPNCWWSETGHHDHDALSSFEERLDAGVAAIAQDLKRLTHANMAEQIDRFVSALNAGVILPEDF